MLAMLEMLVLKLFERKSTIIIKMTNDDNIPVGLYISTIRFFRLVMIFLAVLLKPMLIRGSPRIANYRAKLLFANKLTELQAHAALLQK